ncbi:hypothetical protein PMAYCL1PPCAC_09579, partial [Pristionchus mayeri]
AYDATKEGLNRAGQAVSDTASGAFNVMKEGINRAGQAVTNMPIPYRSLLQEQIEPGQTLIVKGSTIPESQRFMINLHSKSADFSGNDVPMHISFRFDEGKV